MPLDSPVLGKVSQQKREGVTGQFGDNQDWQEAATGWRTRGLDEDGQRGQSLQQRSGHTCRGTGWPWFALPASPESPLLLPLLPSPHPQGLGLDPTILPLPSRRVECEVSPRAVAYGPHIARFH